MKTKLFMLIFAAVLIAGCVKKGEVSNKINGELQNLPEHLNGLTVDYVGVGDGNGIYIATLPDRQTISEAYQSGKVQVSVIVVLPKGNNARTVYAKEILLENDSVLLIRK